MSSLHPLDEVSIRKGSNLMTLAAKKIEAAQIDAEIAEWLAKGNQVNQMQGHNGQSTPFNPTRYIKDKTQSYKFEITPEGKPKPKRFIPGKSTFLSDCAAKVLKPLKHNTPRSKTERLEDIVQVMLTAGHPVTSEQIGKALGLTRTTVNCYLIELNQIGCIRVAGQVWRQRIYEVVK